MAKTEKIQFKKLIIPTLLILNLLISAILAYFVFDFRQDFKADWMFNYKRLSGIETKIKEKTPSIEDHHAFIERYKKGPFIKW